MKGENRHTWCNCAPGSNQSEYKGLRDRKVGIRAVFGREEAETKVEGCSGARPRWALGASAQAATCPQLLRLQSPHYPEWRPDLYSGRARLLGLDASHQHIPDAAAHAGLCTVMPPAGNVFNRQQHPPETAPIHPKMPWGTVTSDLAHI